jgi:hypothetical protein
MGIFNKRAASLGLGLAWALVTGSAAFADDTELFFVDPSLIENQPNVLFILDNSGSMDDRVESQAPYDSRTTYMDAGCGSGRVYWVTVGRSTPALPACSSTQYFKK